MTHDIAVVGAGPAGMLAAIHGALSGKSVVLFDQNPMMGKKLRITGKGRCNLTNAAPLSEWMEQINTNPRFLFSALHAFTNEDAVSFFHSIGIETKTERGGRVFPVCDSAVRVADAMAAFTLSCGVIFRKERVVSLEAKDGRAAGVRLSGGGSVAAGAVVVATGGVSYPATGSTGDGYRLASAAGHRINGPWPSLVPLTAKEEWVRDLMGLSLKNAGVRFFAGEKKLYEDFGELLFTHFGVSGPVVLSASARLKEGDFPCVLMIDLKPGLTLEQLDKRILRDFSEYANRDFANCLDRLLPKKLIPVMGSLSAIAPHTKVHQISKEQRLRLAGLLKGLPLTLAAKRPIREAIVTGGGVCVREINPSTMESKLLPGLFFAGEVIDVDANTGGYNLQIAYSTGYLAGTHA